MMDEQPVKRERNNFWDPVHIEYPVRLAPGTGVSSTTVGHEARPSAQVLREERRDTTGFRGITKNVVQSHRNALPTEDLARSQTSVDYGYKPPTVFEKFCQATPAGHNLYLHGGNKQLDRYPFKSTSHGVSEMRSVYQPPVTSAKMSIDMSHYKHPFTVEPPVEPSDPSISLDPNISSIDISTDCFVKYLDPYVSTSHLEHRPFTSEHLESRANTRDIVTHYTFANVPKVRPGPRPSTGEWWQPKPVRIRRPMSDRAKFQFDFRENRTHNQLTWTPTSFITETAKNFTAPSSHPESRIQSEEGLVREHFNKEAASFRPDDAERRAITEVYATESLDMNSGRPITATINQEKPKNIIFKHIGCKH